MSNYLLSLLIWLPVIGAIPVLLAGSARPNAARWISLLIAVLTFVASLMLLPHYNASDATKQLVENYSWITSINVQFGDPSYHLTRYARQEEPVPA